MHAHGQGTSNWARGAHGFRVDSRSVNTIPRVRMLCQNRKCKYAGSFAYAGLADDLAAEVAKGHAEYQLTS